MYNFLIFHFCRAQSVKVSALENENLHAFLKQVDEIDPSPVILSVMQPYAKNRYPNKLGIYQRA